VNNVGGKVQPWRRRAAILQALTITGIPFVKVKGESALRFDVPSLQLHFFGLNIWMDEFFIVLIGIIFLSLLIVFITLLLGRVWCGWVCPQTVIADFTDFVDRAKNKGLPEKLTAYGAVLLISILVSANLIWYFVSPYEFIPPLLEGGTGNIVWGFWLVLTGILFMNFAFLRQTFCATVCPYAKLQSTLFDSRTLVVAFDPRRKEECIDCMACVKTCPVGIDIREGLNAACIHCAECVDRCTQLMEPRNKKSLVGYFFGMPGEQGGLLRQNVVLLGTVTAAFLIFFLYLLAVRVPLDLTVLPNYAFQPRISRDGSVVNSYILSVRNRGKSNAELKVKVKGEDGTVKIVPDKVLSVEAGGVKKLPVYVSIRDINIQKTSHDLDMIIYSIDNDELAVTGKAHFVIPER
jgi:cytochrome c oxidase accessory protein FixG